MFVGIKVRLYPNKEQKCYIEKMFGNSRYVYNYFLNYAVSNKNYSLEKWITLLELLKSLPQTTFLKIEDKTILEYSLKNLKKAFEDYFNKIRNHPKLKKKSHKQSFTTKYNCKEIKIGQNKIELPILGFIKCKFSRNITLNRILSVTIKKTKQNIYEASLLAVVNVETLPKTGKKVGIDLGVRKLITTSEGLTFTQTTNLNKHLRKLKKNHRILSRKKPGSKNYEKQRLKLAKIYNKQENYINDQIHKATKYLVTNYDIIFMEDLDLNLLLQAQNISFHKRNILNSSLGKIRKMLIYKCKMYNKRLVFINRYFPSTKTCSNCGKKYEVGKSELFKCPYCNLEIDRDKNAAINILRIGKKQIGK